MCSGPRDQKSIDRRRFVKAAMIPVALPIAAVMARPASLAAEQAGGGAGAPEIVDTNVHVFDWPFRKLKYAKTEALVAKLKTHRITQAWAGSFEGVLNKQLDAANRRLVEECRARLSGMLLPVGAVNPAWPDWLEDLRRCHEQYSMRIVRLYPAYHGYGLDHPEFARLLAEAAKRDVLVQIVLRLEDDRVHHYAVQVANVSLAPLAGVLAKIPQAKVQLLNAAGPLLGNNLSALVRETKVTFDIAAVESNGGVGRVIEGKNSSYRGAIPVDRLLFGSHAPFFPCESAVMKLFESPLSLEQLVPIMNSNAQRLIG